MHWQRVFLVFGLLGFAWAILGYRWFRDDPAERSGVNVAERKWIEDRRVASNPHSGRMRDFAELLGQRHDCALHHVFHSDVRILFLYHLASCLFGKRAGNEIRTVGISGRITVAAKRSLPIFWAS